MGLEFHVTVMGHRFFEGQLPQMIQGMEKNNSSMEKLTALLEKQCALLEEQNMLLKALQKVPEKENEADKPASVVWIGEKGGLKYWSNGAGDLFRPGSAWNDTIEEKDLPPELQSAYENLWTDGCGSYCYLVELDGSYGIALINEYDAETGFSQEEVEGRAAEAKEMLTAGNIPFMKVFCAEYSDGDEMAIVLPWDSTKENFNKVADFLYCTAYKKDATYEDYMTERDDSAYFKAQEMEER